MQLCKLRQIDGSPRAAVLAGTKVWLLKSGKTLSDVLHAASPAQAAEDLIDRQATTVDLPRAKMLAPVDRQEIWAAGVTYKRSEEARMRESVGAAQFYNMVYTADRPELFFKATPERVVGHGDLVRVRRDSRWSVPEPELTLVISPSLRVVGYTVGNDMSARDIEGENPLYLPQAKVYTRSCAVGPVITLAPDLPPLEKVTVQLTIERGSQVAFTGATTLDRMKRTFDDLVGWLGRDNSFPHGVLLMTGTGVVPPDSFSLAAGDRVHIDITGIGRLTNDVEQS
jgi:2-dehydro-3-deoxy-D-arabinonate dehydratase